MQRAVTIAGAFALLLTASAQTAERPACKLTSLGSGRVLAVFDGRTLKLADSRELRLAGIEAPSDDGAAKTTLEGLVLGRPVALLRMGAESDRYGRVVAVVTPQSGPNEIGQSVQQALGQARVSANIAELGCTSVLYRAENAARTAGLGLWADSHYVIRQAEDPAAILAVRGHFAVVQGKVLSVRESGGTIYVNFGRRWSEDFTVTASKRHEHAFQAAGLDLKTLAGQQVRVRGTIEERGGPWIEAAYPGQIEVTERN